MSSVAVSHCGTGTCTQRSVLPPVELTSLSIYLSAGVVCTVKSGHRSIGLKPAHTDANVVMSQRQHGVCQSASLSPSHAYKEQL